MKSIFSVIFVIAIMFSTRCVQSQNEDELIKSMLREFYIAHNEVWNNTSLNYREFEDKIFSLQKMYCSYNLQKEIAELYKTYKLEHDLLMDDYGPVDEKLFNSTISVIKESSKSDVYIVSFHDKTTYPSKPKHLIVDIYLKVIKEQDSYRIDKVLQSKFKIVLDTSKN